MSKILQMIPQPLFVFDELKEEVLQESDSMMKYFGKSIESIFPAKIFELRDHEDQDEQRVGTDRGIGGVPQTETNLLPTDRV